ILAAHTVPSKGLKKGLIVEPNILVDAIRDGMKEINDMLGIEIKKVIVNVPSYNSKFLLVDGEVDIKNEHGFVTSDDVNHVIKTSVYNKLDPDYELVTVLPIEYSIDDSEGISKPVGKSGQKLEIKGIMVSTPKKNIYSVLSVIEGAGLEVVDITFSGIGDYYEVRNSNLDKKIGVVINIGHETTDVSVFNRGKLIANDVLQVGGINVEKDLAYVFGVSIFDGRILKEKFASSHKRFCQLNEIYEVKNTIGEKVKLNQLEVSEVAMSRLVEIMNMAKKDIRTLTNQDISYIVLTGGVTEFKSFKNLAYEIFGKDVIIYNVTTLGVRDNKYCTALGMIKYFIDKMESSGREYSMVSVEDETSWVTPNNKLKKDNAIINKIFGGFIAGKEEK
ncbi:MAG: cell division protein FtsA, partial [Bacilli bacterium]|nr:cell division protein FtsA [Bacilli bacterium]